MGLILVSVAASSAEAPSWEAEKVLSLATELDFSIAKVLEVAPEVDPQETAFQQRTRDAAVVEMKRAQDASQRLVEKLRLGWSRGETEPYFHRLSVALSVALRGVARTAGDAVAQEETQPLLSRIEQLRQQLEKLYEQA
jgi:hypothetical protein